MPDLRIPEDLILRVARSINAIEDVRKQAVDDLKTTWGDAREELKALGLTGREISQEVGFLKGAIAEDRMSFEDRKKADEKDEGVDSYLAILNSAHARARTRDAA